MRQCVEVTHPGVTMKLDDGWLGDMWSDAAPSARDNLQWDRTKQWNFGRAQSARKQKMLLLIHQFYEREHFDWHWTSSKKKWEEEKKRILGRVWRCKWHTRTNVACCKRAGPPEGVEQQMSATSGEWSAYVSLWLHLSTGLFIENESFETAEKRLGKRTGYNWKVYRRHYLRKHLLSRSCFHFRRGATSSDGFMKTWKWEDVGGRGNDRVWTSYADGRMGYGRSFRM